MTHPKGILEAADTIVLIDWPSRDVPDTLARAGYGVYVNGGPGPDDYAIHEVVADRVVVREAGHAPERADLVYVHRPVEELPELVTLAKRLGARAIWYQSGLAEDGTRDPRGSWMPEDRSAEARGIVESAGIIYVEHPYIADTVRAAVVRERPA